MTVGDSPEGPFQTTTSTPAGAATEAENAGASPAVAAPAQPTSQGERPVSPSSASEAVAAMLGVPMPGGSSIDIVHTSDMHGHVKAMPYLATIVKQYRASHPEALVLDSGDWARGSEISDIFKGKPMIEIMNQIGYTAAGVGEGDLAWGLGVFLERVAEARFPILAANLVDAEGHPLPGVGSHHVVEVGGRRVALIGVCCPECERPGQTRVLDPRGAVIAAMYTLRSLDVETFIVLSHLGYHEDRALAEAVPGIQCILSGHSHATLPAPEQVGDTLLSCAGRDAQFVGTLSFHFGTTADAAQAGASGGAENTAGATRPSDHGGGTR